MKTYEFPWKGINIPVDVHPCATKAKGVVVYYHGGGLIYGSGRDLPQEYVQAITQDGYHLVCMNYLLAPESSLQDIQESAYQGLIWVLAHRGEWFGDARCPYVLFGRSAGAFLAISLAYEIQQKDGDKPAALWLFYGYCHLNHADFQTPSSYYQSLPQITPELLPPVERAQLCYQASVEQRYLLYVYARQQGNWPRVLQAPEGAGVPYGALAQLPPAFLTASTTDHDVPYVFSQIMHVSMPKSFLLPVYGLEHDYDRNPQRLESQTLYQKVLQWTNDTLEKESGVSK